MKPPPGIPLITVPLAGNATAVRSFPARKIHLKDADEKWIF
jgi:hypothetical protein